MSTTQGHSGRDFGQSPIPSPSRRDFSIFHVLCVLASQNLPAWLASSFSLIYGVGPGYEVMGLEQ